MELVRIVSVKVKLIVPVFKSRMKSLRSGDTMSGIMVEA